MDSNNLQNQIRVLNDQIDSISIGITENSKIADKMVVTKFASMMREKTDIDNKPVASICWRKESESG